jgi:hypothetical protein
VLNMKCQRLYALIVSVVMFFVAATNAIAQPTPQTTAFTYQGQLNAGGILPSGQTYYFTFTLYDSVSGPNVVAGPINQAILVGNGGLFTTDLDFGQIFNGTQYWLEIKVGATALTEQVLANRQPINAVPVAQYSLNSPPGAFADFYALMPPDNAATVAAGSAVQFPQDGPTSGTVITRLDASTFNLSAIGTYQVMFQVSVSEAGQLVLVLNGAEQPYTVVGRATSTSQIVGMALITTSVVNSTLSVRNPAAGFVALTVTPSAGGGDSVSAHLVITLLH